MHTRNNWKYAHFSAISLCAKMPDNKFLCRKCTRTEKNLRMKSTFLTIQTFYRIIIPRCTPRECMSKRPFFFFVSFFLFYTLKITGIHILDVFTWYNNIALRLWSILYFIQTISHKYYADYVTVTQRAYNRHFTISLNGALGIFFAFAKWAKRF